MQHFEWVLEEMISQVNKVDVKPPGRRQGRHLA
jgi:hypothetical protein